MSPRGARAPVVPLGDSPFNYGLKTYNAQRFVHYFNVIRYTLELQPQNALEVGPGDHVVTDFLRRKGVDVSTFDFDEELHPDFIGDIREPLRVGGPYDVVIASEVLEHLPFRLFDRAVENLAAVVRPGGHLLISLPYVTLRLLPPDSRDGTIVSSSGRLRTRIPIHYVMPLLIALRFVFKITTGAGWRAATAPYGIPPDLPDDNFLLHHWEVGRRPTTSGALRTRLQQKFSSVIEHKHDDTNNIFYIARISPTMRGSGKGAT